MITRLFLLLGLFLCSCCVFGQDQLFTRDNRKLEVKIMEINQAQVKYKLKENPDGPAYVINKAEVSLIIYENGKHETFPNASQPVAQQQKDSINQSKTDERLDRLTKTQHAVFLNIAELANTGIGVSYMQEFWDNRITLQVPFAVSFDRPAAHNLVSYYGSLGYNTFRYTAVNYPILTVNNKLFESGLGIYFNTSGKRAVTHFIGPYFRYARFAGNYSVKDNSLQTQQINFLLDETYLLLNNGLLIRATPYFNIMLNLGIGAVTSKKFVTGDPADHAPNGKFTPPPQHYLNVQLGVHFGFRF